LPGNRTWIASVYEFDVFYRIEKQPSGALYGIGAALLDELCAGCNPSIATDERPASWDIMMSNSTGFGILQEHAAPPASETETKLAGLWAELLQREAVDIHDDYFALGGNSLLAVNLFVRVEAEFGVRLPLTSIIEAPTVAQFARLLENRGSHTPVVLIREGGDELPLFLVHDADGETVIYRSLALHLDPGHAIYGLQPHSKADHPILHTRIEEMAAFHISNIRTIQPRGPYLLGGLCAGGLISFEMARQLERDGETVLMVALMDAADVAAKMRTLQVAKQRLTRFASAFDQGKDIPRWRRALAGTRTAVRKAGNLARYMVGSRVRTSRDRARMAMFRLHLKLGLRMPAYLQNISVRTAYGSAKLGYRPATPFGGELLLLRATFGVGDDEAFGNRYSDPLMGWGPRSARGVRVVDVPGGHSSMLQEPNARVIAEKLQSYINQATDRSVPPAARPEAPPARVEGSEGPGEEAPGREEPGPSRPTRLLVVSTSSQDAMEGAADRLAGYIAGCAEGDLPDVSYTLAVGWPAFEWRRSAVGGGREELIERLRKGTGRGAWTGADRAARRPVAFILAGVGEQAAGVGRGLYEGEPAFRDAVDRCADILRPILGRDIREAMLAAPAQASNWLRGGGGGVLKETRVAQPAAFVLDWALARMWMSWGIRPAAVLGYSVGEYAAAALAGVLRMEDALLMLARRAEWIDEMAEPGVMLAVPVAEAEIRPRLGEGVWVAAANSPQATVLGGREDAIRRLEEELQAAGVVARRVVSMNGTHTPLLSPVKDNLRQLVEGMRREPPRIPMLSNVTGTWLTEAESQDDNYWGEHMCGTLRFEEGVGELLRGGERVLLEVGPGAGLGAMVRQHALCGREQMGRVLASLPAAWDRVSEHEHVAGVLGKLWVEGVDVDWKAYYSGERRRRVALPGDPAERRNQAESLQPANHGDVVSLTESR
jgi:thioesterase domain-containing protein/malonyl CoA-acyl carrier protein transacylase/acyl carrier protein